MAVFAAFSALYDAAAGELGLRGGRVVSGGGCLLHVPRGGVAPLKAILPRLRGNDHVPVQHYMGSGNFRAKGGKEVPRRERLGDCPIVGAARGKGRQPRSRSLGSGEPAAGDAVYCPRLLSPEHFRRTTTRPYAWLGQSGGPGILGRALRLRQQ